MSADQTLPAAYFEALYAENPDPWDFATSPYEDAKYAATLAALGERRFRRGLEVGCSIGVLTKTLSTIADAWVAVDISERALSAAKARNAERTNVTFRLGSIPSDLPAGPFDLIVLSEVLYYLNEADLARATGALLDRLTAEGEVLLVHWLGETDYPLTGDDAAEGFIRQGGPRLTTIQQTRREKYRLDHLRRTA